MRGLHRFVRVWIQLLDCPFLRRDPCRSRRRRPFHAALCYLRKTTGEGNHRVPPISHSFLLSNGSVQWRFGAETEYPDVSLLVPYESFLSFTNNICTDRDAVYLLRQKRIADCCTQRVSSSHGAPRRIIGAYRAFTNGALRTAVPSILHRK